MTIDELLAADMTANDEIPILFTGTHYISNSGSDENGKYKGGNAGDQTGKEVARDATE